MEHRSRAVKKFRCEMILPVLSFRRGQWRLHAICFWGHWIFCHSRTQHTILKVSYCGNAFFVTAKYKRCVYQNDYIMETNRRIKQTLPQRITLVSSNVIVGQQTKQTATMYMYSIGFLNVRCKENASIELVYKRLSLREI